MQLRINTSIKKSVITVELETINFCGIENKMLDQFGEPVFHLEKMYQQEYPVSIHKKIRSNFKVKVRFDGTNDIDKATLAANEFIDEVKESLPILMEEFMDKAEFIDIQAGQEVINVTSGCYHPPVYPRHPHGGYSH